MSTPRADEDPEDEPRAALANGAFLRAMRVLAAISALVALYALWSVERVDIDCDLQLAAPPEVRPGEPFAVRAIVFCDLDALEGPRLVTPVVTLRSLDAEGHELMPALGPTTLHATALETLDGVHHAMGEGEQFLVATASYQGTPLHVKRALRVHQDAAPERLVPREAGPLQQYALGRVRVVGPGPAPDRLIPRVVGGACVPEVPCTIVLWVGAPAASVRLRTAASAEGNETSQEETDGLLRFEVTVHGPEAELTFEARRGGVPVAERALRLPVALGEVALVGRSEVSTSLTLRYPPGRSAATIDVFLGGRWNNLDVRGPEQTSFAPAELVRLRGTIPEPLLRVQARADRFSSDGAGARVLFVPNDNPRHSAIAELAGLLEAEPWRSAIAPLDEPGVPRASELWAKVPPHGHADAAAFLLAPLESLRAQVPLPASGRPAQLARLEHTKVRMRYGVAGAIALSAWLIGLSITRRGLLAVDQAQVIMARARGDEDGHTAPRERINARAKVLLMGLAVAAAFLAGALLIAAKSLWF